MKIYLELTIQVKFKGTEEIVTLSCNEVVEAGNESVKFTGKGPASGNIGWCANIKI